MNAVIKQDAAHLPDFLKGGKTSKVGNITTSDLIIPRVKLLQAISPELTTFSGAKAGEFFHTIAGETLGPKLRVVPIIIRKSLVLWAPRNDSRGILARSRDCINWDPGYANMSYTVKPKGSPSDITYETKGNVMESGLAEFGSSIPGDMRSKPAASLTYNIMFHFLDFPDLSPAIVINTRSSIRAAQMLISKIEMRPVDHFAQIFEMSISQETSDDGPYFGYNYTGAGYVDEAQYAMTKATFDKFKEAEWSANDENDESADVSSGGTKNTRSEVSEKNKGKF